VWGGVENNDGVLDGGGLRFEIVDGCSPCINVTLGKLISDESY
jgi:hypothetical protein